MTGWLPVTQDRIRRFADATEDRQWIHIDPERARHETPFGGSIAHGFLSLSLVSYFLSQAIRIRSGIKMTVNYGLNKVRFPSPLPAGSPVRARLTLQSVKESPEFVDAAFLIRVETEAVGGGAPAKPCCVAEWLIRYYRE